MQNPRHHSSHKIMGFEEAREAVKAWQAQGQKVVFTNGCFDILHLGHVDYMEKAANLGHRLIIGLNSDQSISRLKGPKRPVNPIYARARLLAALAFVDAVVEFDQDTPLELISFLMPDILTKGSDYRPDQIVGAKEVIANGGEVKTIDLVDGYSTTGIIHKMRDEN